MWMITGSPSGDRRRQAPQAKRANQAWLERTGAKGPVRENGKETCNGMDVSGQRSSQG
jgi:hypothetical protein